MNAKLCIRRAFGVALAAIGSAHGAIAGRQRRARHRRQLHPRRVRPLFRQHRQGRRRSESSITAASRRAIDNQTVIRLNRDTLYSSAVFDLDAGPVTITLPDAGKRFMSMQVINEDHYVPAVVYGAGTLHARPRRRSARAMSLVGDPHAGRSRPTRRTSQQVHALQDAIKVEPEERRHVRGAELGSGQPEEGARRAAGARLRRCPTSRRRSAPRSEVDPVRHLIGTAAGWGGNPDKDATYLNVTPAKNDGTTVYKLNVKDVPVDGFWSVSVYNAEGYFEKNPYNAYSLNNITAKKSADGSVAIQFGGCDGKIPNCLPIMKGWNYTVRLYRPRAEILNGKWKFPEPQPVN